MKQFQTNSGCEQWLAGIVLGSSLLLAGCQTVSKPSPPPALAVEAPKSRPEVKENRIGICQSELASLKMISPKSYAVRKAYFDSLLRSASTYIAVRGDVSMQTKDTLDALYKYKTNQICAQIERDVLEALIRKGESVK